MAVASCPPTVTFAPAITFSGVAPCSTTFTVTGCSVRSLGLATPPATVTGTSTDVPSGSSTFTLPWATSGTPGTVTEPSPSVSVAPCAAPLSSVIVTFAPLPTVKFTLWLPAFASSILAGLATPAASTVRVLPLIAVYPVAAAPRSR